MNKLKSVFKFTVLFLLVISVISLPVKANGIEPRANLATVTIFSTKENNHSWLTVKNTSGGTIKVGHLNVSNGDTVSLGTWGNIKQHKGIWYNYELYLGSSKFSTHVSISRNITSTTQLNKFNTTINGRDSWSLLNTCSSFAGSVWDQTFADKVNVGVLPSYLADSIIKLGGYTTNRSMPSRNVSAIYYHTSSGGQQTTPIGGGSSSKSLTDNTVTSFPLEILEDINYMQMNLGK